MLNSKMSQNILSRNFHITSAVILVTEGSQDTGLVYPVCGEVGRKVEVHHERLLFSFEEQHAIAEKLILAIQVKKKLSRKIKKCFRKVCKQD